MINKNIKQKDIRKYVLIGVCGVLAASSIFMTVEAATSSVEVASLQKEEIQLADQKRYLENNLVKSMSQGQLEVKSQELGFAKPGILVYVAPAEAVAKLP